MTIYIYNGPGCSTFSARNLKHGLGMALNRFDFDIEFISAQEIIDGSKLSPDNATMLVMGGGRFTEVKAALGPEGLSNIQEYTKAGGLYTGICMGSYAAFDNIDFRGEQRKTSNGLGFFNTTARGSLPVTLPYDGTGNSATILEIQHMHRPTKFPALYWGGNGMDEADLLKIGAVPLSKLTLSSGEEKIMSARVDVGDQGGKAFLCGYHPEGHSRKIIWDWLVGLSPNSDCYERLRHELIQHPDKAYLMALACLLDDIQLVPEHSFVQQVHAGWPYVELMDELPTPDWDIVLPRPKNP